MDRDCELKQVTVVDDYSCHLQLDDISYNEDQQTRYIVVQLYERAGGKKWTLWTKQGRVTSDSFNTKVKDFYEKYEAINKFCEYFFKKTGNKWADRTYFQHKPGMYMLLNKETEMEAIKKYQEFEKVLIEVMKASAEKF